MITKENGMVINREEDKNPTRLLLQEISISCTKDRRISPESTVRMFNSSQVLNEDLSETGAQPVRAQTTTMTVEEWAIALGITYDKFVGVWADNAVKQLGGE